MVAVFIIAIVAVSYIVSTRIHPLTKCPTCKRMVEIPDELMGKKVRCPSCKIIFLATAGGPCLRPRCPRLAFASARPVAAHWPGPARHRGR